jgi:N-acetylmuramoyl-L-alanine amidase
MRTVILDAGHGGVVNGTYVTPGKRSPALQDGRVLYEGEFNRAIVARVMEKLTILGIPYDTTYDLGRDTPLHERVVAANYYKGSDAWLLSIHSNAGGGEGCEVFTTPGQNRSDEVAQCFADVYPKYFPDFRFRTDPSDGDADKEANFQLLKGTNCPSILVECFFMDNPHECKHLLMTDTGRDQIAAWIVKGIETVYEKVFK